MSRYLDSFIIDYHDSFKTLIRHYVPSLIRDSCPIFVVIMKRTRNAQIIRTLFGLFEYIYFFYILTSAKVNLTLLKA